MRSPSPRSAVKPGLAPRLVCLAMALAGVTGGCAGTPAAMDGAGAAGTARPEALGPATLLVDLQAGEAPTATFAAVSAGGEARWLRYNPAQLRVTAAGEGKVAAETARRLLERTADPAFQEALRRRNYAGEGLATGNQFRVRLRRGEGPGEEAFGFLQDAPPALRSVVAEALALAVRAAARPPADAYMRSRPVESERFRTTLREGKLRYFPLASFPDDLRRLLAGALQRPDDFVPLTGAQFRRLSERTSHGQDLFLAQEERGYQLTLFRGGEAPPSPKEEKAP